jgi:serine/threonine-protein kinase RsbW
MHLLNDTPNHSKESPATPQNDPQPNITHYEEGIRLEIPAEYRFLNVVAACIDAVLEPFETQTDKTTLVYQVRLAVHEACTNIIDHAYGNRGTGQTRSKPGRIEIQFSCKQNARRLVIDLYDSGAASTLPPIQSPDPQNVQTSGYGLFLMHELMSEVFYESQPGKNHWKLVKLF